jgi:pleiotropic regulator 1
MYSNVCKRLSKKIIMIKKWTKTKLLLGHKEKINSLKFDFNNKIFATASSDQTIRLWESSYYKNISVLKGHSSAVNCIFFYKKFPYIFSGGDDHQIRSWDIEYNRIFRLYSGHFSGITNFAYHPILDIFFSCSKDKTIRLWDLRTMKQIQVIYFPSKIVSSIIVDSESPHFVTSDSDKKLCFWDLIAGKCYKIIEKNPQKIVQLEKHPHNFSFYGLSSNALINWRKDGLVLKNFKNIYSSNYSFCTNKKNEIALSFSSGWIKIFNYLRTKNDIDFFFPSKLLKKEEKDSCVSTMCFNLQDVSHLITCVGKSIKIFEKKWKSKIKNLS